MRTILKIVRTQCRCDSETSFFPNNVTNLSQDASATSSFLWCPSMCSSDQENGWSVYVPVPDFLVRSSAIAI